MRALDRKLARDLWRMRGQAVAVCLVVLSGTACYIAVASAYRNLLLTRDTYYDQYRFADFEILLERAPVTALQRLKELPNVREVRARIVKDVSVDLGDDEPRVGRIVSMPDAQDAVINDIHLAQGRYFDPAALNEVIVSDSFAAANGLGIGDHFSATIDNRKHSLRIVGTALSPEYVYQIRNTQGLVPDPERFGIVWASKSFAEMAFDMTGACNNIVGMVENANALEQTLDRAESLLDSYGVFAKVKAEDQISNRFLSDEIKGLGVTARITPALFLGIAAMIILVLLNRMVRQERTQIGLLKAYGYSNFAVALHYIKYALVLGLAGCAGGAVVGQWLAGGMIGLYVQYYQFPLLRSQVFPDVMVRAFGITIAFALAGAVTAAYHAARIQPADAMRPQAPRYGHRSVLELAPLLWRRLSFSWKMIVRNIARYRLRAAITVFGVAVSSAILLVGFFMFDSMAWMIDFQFEQVQREDMSVSLESERGKGALYDLARMDPVRRAEPLLRYPFNARTRWRSKDLGITGLPDGATLYGLVDRAGRGVRVGQSGIVLGEWLAHDLGVGPGDVLTLKPLQGRIATEYEVPVRQVVQQYFGSGAYMNIDALSRLLDEPFAMNAALLRIDAGSGPALNQQLKDVPGVAAVEMKSDARTALENTIEQSMGITNTFTAFFAGLIAFSVIYNATMVSLMERQRELASLRVLGLTTQEVGAIVYNENFVLSFTGIACGVPAGYALCRLLVRAYSTELFRLPLYIAPRTYAITVILAVLFVVAANVAVWHRIHRLDMVEVLKERE